MNSSGTRFPSGSAAKRVPHDRKGVILKRSQPEELLEYLGVKKDKRTKDGFRDSYNQLPILFSAFFIEWDASFAAGSPDLADDRGIQYLAVFAAGSLSQ